jgi:hypothetical protein
MSAVDKVKVLAHLREQAGKALLLDAVKAVIKYDEVDDRMASASVYRLAVEKCRAAVAEVEAK